MKKLLFYLTVFSAFIGSQTVMAQTPIMFDIEQGPNSSYPYEIKQIGDKLVFIYDDANGDERIAYINGAGQIVKPTYQFPTDFAMNDMSSNSSTYGYLYDYNGTAYWIQSFYNSMEDNWYDFVCMLGTNTVTTISDKDTYPYDLAVYNNKLMIAGDDATAGGELLSYDGTTLGVEYDIEPGIGSAYPSSLRLANGNLYFLYTDAIGDTYFGEYNGSTLTNALVTTSPNYAYSLDNLQTLDDTLYFSLYVGGLGEQLGKWSNSTLNIQSLPSMVYSVQDLVTYNNKLYLATSASGYPSPLFIYTPGDAQFQNLVNPSYSNLYVYDLIVFNDTVFFEMTNTTNWQSNLTKLDPSDDSFIEMNFSIQNGSISYTTIVDNEMYMSTDVYDGVNYLGREPIRYINGDAELVYNVVPGNWNGSYPSNFSSFNGMLAFAGDTPSNGTELYIMCMNNTVPSAPGTQVACENSTVADLDATGGNLFWYDAPTGGNVVNPSTVITTAGSYYVATRYICESSRIEVPFTVSTLPNTATAYLGNGDIKVINPTSLYQWVDCGTGLDLVGENNQILTVPGNGSYKCILTNADGCEVETACIYVINLGLNEAQNDQVLMFPNPAADQLNITSKENMSKLTMTSLAGELVKSVTPNATAHKLDVSTLANGTYLVHIFNESNTLISVQKVIVNR